MRTRLAIAVLLGLTAAAVVVAQSPQQTPQEPRPTFRTEANYVRVDMYATRDDKPVEDLTPEDLEILEDGVAQKIATFEHVQVRPAGPQDTRVEPNNVAASRQAAADPRARVFVIFLDTHHIDFQDAGRTRGPVVQFLDRAIGQDDLVAVMTPDMAAADVTLGRKTVVLAKMLDETWTWARRERLLSEDPRERLYAYCFGDASGGELMARRREKLTLDTLRELIAHLDGIREERKAVLVISEGWRLFTVNGNLAARGGGRGLGPDPIHVGPDGKLRRGTDTRNTSEAISGEQCEADRLELAGWDARQALHELFGRANRANVSFYTVHSRGLVARDGSLFSGSGLPEPASQDGRNLRARLDALRALAENTDGLAVQDTNAVDQAMQRIVSDLTSYYLVGYYSTNGRLDGKFREISIRVKRPGVRVRARRGYRAATAAELTTAARGKPMAPTALSRAFAALAGAGARGPLRIRSASWHAAGSASRPGGAVWLVGEVDRGTRKDLAWTAGATGDVTVSSSTGANVAAKSIEMPPGEGAFALRVPDAGGLEPGDYVIRVRVRPKQDASLSTTEMLKVVVAADPAPLGESVLWRRGPVTGPRYTPTADPHFQRRERLRLEHAVTDPALPVARLLDRNGNPINVPVQVTRRPDPSGDFQWAVADVTLAPLGAGEYAIELTLADSTVITAFKVVP